MKHTTVFVVAIMAMALFGAGCSFGQSARTRPAELGPAPAPTMAPTIPPEAANIPKPY